MTHQALGISHPDIQGFQVTHLDGTQTVVHCQQACLDSPFVSFWHVNENQTRETLISLVATASVYTVTPIYCDGSPSAALVAEEPAT